MNAAVIVGIARKNENSAAAVRLSPAAMPPTMVAPDLDTPGTSANIWQTPTASARGSGVSSARCDDGRPHPSLEEQHHDAPGDERPCEHRGTLIQDALDEISEQRSGQQRGNCRHDDGSGEAAWLRLAFAGAR